MRVESRRIGSVFILDLDGRLVVEADFERFLDALHASLRQRVSRIILNFSGVHALDCAGIGLLVSAYCAVQQSGGGELVLVNVKRHLRRLLELAGLLAVFRVYDSELDAIADLRRCRLEGACVERSLGSAASR